MGLNVSGQYPADGDGGDLDQALMHLGGGELCRPGDDLADSLARGAQAEEGSNQEVD